MTTQSRHRLEQLGDERLQRVALDRQPQPGHVGEHRRVAGGGERDASGADRPARRLDAGDAAALDVEAGHLAVLDEVDAERVGARARSPTRRGRAWRSRRAAGSVAPSTGSARPARRSMIGQTSLTLVGVEPLRVDAVQPVRVTRRTLSRTSLQVVREVQHAALAEQDVVVELLRQPLPQLERVLVDRRALVPEVVRADDRRVAAHVAAAEPAALEHGDVRDAVVLREVVGGREAVPAGADDHDVVGPLRVRRAPEEVGVLVLRATQNAGVGTGSSPSSIRRRAT